MLTQASPREDQSQECPACKALCSQIVRTGCKDFFHHFPGEWSLIECERCQLIFTAPGMPPERLQHYYPAEYSAHHTSAELSASRLGNALRKLVMVPYRLRYGEPGWRPSPVGQGRLLEVGCGSGRMLKHMAKLGWKCFGLDISRAAVAEASRHVPEATVVASSLADFRTDDRFDLLVMFHVLEHLSDPVESLNRCYDLLSPGGKLLISVPNVASFEARLFGKYWSGLDLPRHVVHFKEPVLIRMIESAGFTVLEGRPGMLASSVSESLLCMLPPTLRKGPLYTRLARLLYLLSIFPASLSYALNNRGTIELIAQKPAGGQHG